MAGVFREGDRIGSRYRLDRLLGEGGFAVVWAATHDVTRRRVALKLLKEHFAADVRVRQRFLREARVASAVRHPNVIAIQDVFEHDGGRPVIVMDLLEGESLGERIRRNGALPLQDVATIVLPVVSAVECAHALGIVHRDLKPDNIFLARPAASPDGPIEVKVLDFGIAKLTAREGDAARSGGLTNTGALLGTPYYMSPEQIFGDGDVDARSDVWSLGVILYECLAGVRPTQAESVGQIIRIIASDSIVPLEQRRPELPDDVTGIVKRALSFDNAARPTVAELRGVVAAHLGAGSRLVVTPSGPPPTTGFEDTEEGPVQPGGRASTQSSLTLSTAERRKARRVVPLALVAAGLAVAGTGLVAWRSSTRPEPAVVPDRAPQVPQAAMAAESATARAPVAALVSATATGESILPAPTAPATVTAATRATSRPTAANAAPPALPRATVSASAPAQAPSADPASYR